MMRSEFDALTESVKGKCTDEQWIVINRVYTFHPSIKDVGGKTQVAMLFLEHGFVIFQDMLPRAEKMAELDCIRRSHLIELETIDRQIQELTNPA